MILLLLLLTTLLFQEMSSHLKTKFDPDLKKLKGLSCYQCKRSDKFCHSQTFYSSPKKVKLDMLIQCPQDCKYCVKREVWIDEETSHIDRGCSRPVDSLGQEVKAGCMVLNEIEVCLCEKNLCNCSNKMVINQFNIFGIINMLGLNLII